MSMGIKTRAADPVYKLCYFLVHRIEQPKGIIILFHSFLKIALPKIIERSFFQKTEVN